MLNYADLDLNQSGQYGQIYAEVLMSDAKKQYEDMFGSSIWTEDIAGQPFEEYKKVDK